MSKTRQRRRARQWRRYLRTIDALVAHQGQTAALHHPMRMPGGYIRRAEGHSRDFIRQIRKTGL